MERILDAIKSLKLNNINLLALVTDTSFEVVFYATVDNTYGQSNELAEAGKIDMLALDNFYRLVADCIRKSKSYKEDKLNIYKITPDLNSNFTYLEKNSRIYALKKEWKESFSK